MTCKSTIIPRELQHANKAIGVYAWRTGRCSICGDESGSTIRSYAEARYWDPDDGWMLGVLCPACAELCRMPEEDDYAYESEGDAFSETGDID